MGNFILFMKLLNFVLLLATLLTYVQASSDSFKNAMDDFDKAMAKSRANLDGLGAKVASSFVCCYVGIIVGVVVFLILCIVLICCLIKKSSQPPQTTVVQMQPTGQQQQ